MDSLPKTTPSKSWRNGIRPINNLRSSASSVLSQEQILTVLLRVKVKLYIGSVLQCLQYEEAGREVLHPPEHPEECFFMKHCDSSNFD